MAKKYLIVKIAAIGDVIMALPMVEEIRKLDKDANITWICGKGAKTLLEPFDIDHIITLDEKKLLSGTKYEKISVVFRLWKQIAGRKYDVIALGHGDKRYKLLTMLTRCNTFSAFSHVMRKVCPIPGRHHTDEYVRLINPENKKPVQAVKFPKVELPLEIKKLLLRDKPLAVLAPGGIVDRNDGRWLRRWPINNYVKLAELLLEKYNIVVVGDLEDSWIKKYLSHIKVIDLIGKTNLRQLIGVFQAAEIAIIHDSGPLHLAGMTNTTLVGIFGPTNPQSFMPRRANVHCLHKSNCLSCCPCYDGKYYAECKDNTCMSDITVDDVLKQIVQVK